MGLKADVVDTNEIGYFRVFVQPKGMRSREVTFFRNAATKVGQIRTADPFTDISLTLSFPQVTIFDTIGAGDLSWMQPEANVDVIWHNVGDYEYDWSFEGYLVNPNYVSSEGDNSVTWEVKGALLKLDNYLAQPWFPAQPIPYETLIARAFDQGRHPAGLAQFAMEWPDTNSHLNIPIPENELPLDEVPRAVPNPTSPVDPGNPTTPNPGTPGASGPPKKLTDVIPSISRWKLTLPISSGGELLEIPGKTLAKATPVYKRAGYFEMNSYGISFTCPAKGPTTGGSKYPRTELREQWGGNDTGWNWKDGRTHTMSITQKVVSLPNSPQKVVVGQIHSHGNNSDDVLRILLEGKKLTASFSGGKGKDGPQIPIDNNYTLNTEFTITLSMNSGGVKVTYQKGNGAVKTVASGQKPYSGSPSTMYFKAGMYTQSTSGSGVGRVYIRKLVLTHK